MKFIILLKYGFKNRRESEKKLNDNYIVCRPAPKKKRKDRIFIVILNESCFSRTKCLPAAGRKNPVNDFT